MRTLEDALNHANKIKDEFDQYIQPNDSDIDMITMLHEIERLEEDNKHISDVLDTAHHLVHELEEMIDIAWDAIVEANYEGFSNKLRNYME